MIKKIPLNHKIFMFFFLFSRKKISLNLQNFAQNKITAYKWCMDIFFPTSKVLILFLLVGIAY